MADTNNPQAAQPSKFDLLVGKNVPLRHRLVPKGMARMTYLVQPATKERIEKVMSLQDLAQEIHLVFTANAASDTACPLAVDTWTHNRNGFWFHFREDPALEINVHRIKVSPTKYHFAVYLNDISKYPTHLTGGEYDEVLTMFVDFKLRSLVEVSDVDAA